VLHVADASQPEDRLVDQLHAVDTVLHEIGASALPLLLVLNKVDRLAPLPRRRLAGRYRDAVQISALTGEGSGRVARTDCEPLRPSGSRRSGCSSRTTRAHASRSCTHSARPVEERRDEPEGVFVRARLPRRDHVRFAPLRDRGGKRTREIG
jgi:GTP-binding protein HflX